MTITAISARPHPKAPNAYELWFMFVDGTEERMDRGAYLAQPARSIAESYQVPLEIEQPAMTDDTYTEANDTPRCICCMDNGCAMCQPPLLPLMRALIDTQRKYDAAMYNCENHRQAGYDTGYHDKFARESDELRAMYYHWSEEVDRLELMIWDLFNHDILAYNKARRIVSKFA